VGWQEYQCEVEEKNKMKDLSIIIITRNNKQLLKECLNSIKNNTHKIKYELIVTDNGSTDGSIDLVKREFPDVKLAENRTNLGFAKANNNGLKLGQGRYSMLLNDDTVIKDSALDKLVEFMDKTPKAGACGPRLLNTDGSIQHQGGLFGKKFWLAHHPITVDFVIGAALLVRKEVIDQVGLMDEHLFFYNDDLDWCVSIREAGWQIYFVPEAEITHYGGFSSRTFQQKLFVEGFKGGLYFCRKHYGELAFHFYRLLLSLLLCLVLPFKILNQEKLKAYLEVIRLAWRGQIPKPVIK